MTTPLLILLSISGYVLFLIFVSSKTPRIVGACVFPVFATLVYCVVKYQEMAPAFNFDHAIFALVSSAFAFSILLFGGALYVLILSINFLLYFLWDKKEKRGVKESEEKKDVV